MKKLIMSFVLFSLILTAISQPKTAAEFIKTADLWKARSASSAGNWENIGISDNVRVGRVNCIAFHPDNTDIIYAGTPAGGLWKTEDHGTSWHCLTDDLPTLGVSAIVVIPKPGGDIIYIGTGDRDRDNSFSAGVFKSTDGGSTWNTTALSLNTSDQVQVTGLIRHPDNDDTIYAITSYRFGATDFDGLYITYDGGKTWPKISNSTLDINSRFIDIEINPQNTDQIFLSTRGDGLDSTYIYRSNDAGGTWDIIFRTKGRRTEMTISTDINKPKWLYAAVADTIMSINGNSECGLKGVYKFSEDGSSYFQITNGKDINLLGRTKDGQDIGVGQGEYDLCIAVDPNEGNRLFVGGINTFVSDDGNNWVWDNYDNVSILQIFQKYHSHADKHQLIFRPGTSQLYECNDGGIFERKSKRSWDGISKGMVISQMYRLGLNRNNKDNMLAGLQDNGTQKFTGSNWNRIHHSDGMECIIDYDHPATQYASHQNGFIVRTKIAWTGVDPINITQKNGKPINGLKETGGWVTPYLMDPDDHKTLFLGLENVWISTNQGDRWRKISSFGTKDNKIDALAVAKNGEINRFVYASVGSNLWWTYNSGKNWTQAPQFPQHISYITIKNSASPKAWVTMDGGYNPDGVYEFDAATNVISNISKGLPEVPVYCIIQNKNNFMDDELYAGTQEGVYRKIGPLEWEPFNSGLPNVSVQELEIFYSGIASATLHAATFGRGMWRSEIEFYDYRLWTGEKSFDWYDTENWYPKILPGSSTNVYIPSVCPNWPLINSLTLGTDCKNIRMYDSSKLYINSDLEIGTGCKLICDSMSQLYVGGGWKNKNDAVQINDGFGFLPELSSEVIFNFQYDAPLFAAAGTETFQNLTINKVVPGPGRFKPSSNVVVNQFCHHVSGYWDDAGVLTHKLFGDFLIEAPGIFHMQPGGVLEFAGTDPQSLKTLSPDYYNNFRTLKINGNEVIQESNMSASNKIYENLTIEKGKYSVGKLNTEVLGTVSIAANTILRLDKTTLMINNLFVYKDGLFHAGGIPGDSTRISKAGTMNYTFQVDGNIETGFTRFDGMNANGIYISENGNIFGGFNNCTFSTDLINAALLTINNDKTHDLYDINFNFISSQKSVSKTVNTGNVNINDFQPLNSPDYEDDIYDRIFWTTSLKKMLVPWVENRKDSNAVPAHPAHRDNVRPYYTNAAVQTDVIIENFKEGFNIYPNPGYGIFIVTLNLPGDNTGNKTIQVINGSGQVVKQINTNNQSKLNINLKEAGIYLIRLNIGKQVITKKLVVVP